MHGLGSQLFDIVRGYFDAYGYWTLAGVLLLENAGIPVPGETMLLFASFLAFSEQQLQLPYIILIGIVACTLGDNIGYAVGRRGGRPLLDRYASVFRIRKETIAEGERLFARHGNLTIFIARFVFGMRIIAGPLAGVLHMPWKHFVVFNFLGASVWVSVISLLGYKFGEHWEELVKMLGRANFIIAAVALYIVFFLWRRRRRRQQRPPEPPESASPETDSLTEQSKTRR